MQPNGIFPFSSKTFKANELRVPNRENQEKKSKGFHLSLGFTQVKVHNPCTAHSGKAGNTDLPRSSSQTCTVSVRSLAKSQLPSLTGERPQVGVALCGGRIAGWWKKFSCDFKEILQAEKKMHP